MTLVRSPALTAGQRRAVSAAGLGPLLRGAGEELGLGRSASVAVRLSDDAELQALNARFLGVDEPTDVLAFPATGSTSSRATADGRVGDVAISVERAMEQAADGAAELRLLAVHGLLHCLGHDHADEPGARRMTDLTRRLLPHQEVPELTTT